ncbi:MAG TPA: hypothetical protein PLI98_10390, partial [Candidatus Hydrogenedentes bacterium]|nr:hypothetical protein [Candidatus Hydrogenedentota bacterium]
MSQLTPGNLVSGFAQGYEQMSGMMDEGTRALNAAASGAPFEYAPETPAQQPVVDRSQMGWFPRAAYDVASNLAPSIAAPLVERALPTAAVGAGVGGAAGALGLGVGAVPGALAGAGTGATTGMTLGAYEMGVGDILQTMKQAGVDAGDAQMLALAYTIPYAAMEMLQLGVAGKYALGVLKKSISGVAAKEITPEIAKNLVARAVKEGGKLAAGTASEIVAEGAQKGIAEVATANALYNTGESERAADVVKGIPASMLQEMKDVSGPMLLTGGVGGSVSLAKGAARNLTPMDPLKVSREEWVEAGYDPLEHEKAYTEAMESWDRARIKKVSAATIRSYMTPEQPDAATETPPEPQTEPPADEETPEPPFAPLGPSGTRIPAPEEFDDPEGLTRTALDAAHPEGWTADDDTIEFLHATETTRESWIEQGGDPEAHRRQVLRGIELGVPVPDEVAAPYYTEDADFEAEPGDVSPPPGDVSPETPPEPQTEPPADEETPEPPFAPLGPSGTRIPAPEEFDDPEGLTRTALDAAHPEGWTADDDTIEFLHATETTRESWIAQGGDPEAHRRQVLRGIELGVPVPDEVAAPYYTDNAEEDVAEDPMADVLPAKTDVEEVEARRASDAQTYNVPPGDTSQPTAEPELPGMTEPETEATNAPDPVENVAVPDPAEEPGATPVVEEPPVGMPEDVGEGAAEEQAPPVDEPSGIPGELDAPASQPPAAPQSMVDEFQAVMDVGAHPPVYIPVKGLELSKEVPNFKKDADPETGEVEPLEGEFDDRGVAPIAVWRRTDGRLEVISGRHRLAHAKRNNRNSILSQVFNEADGFGADQAAALDAELNIRDGHGKVTDYGSYFRRAGLSKATARKRGLLRDTEARKGFTIGTMGSDDVFTSWENGAIETGPALAIVETAGADNAGQAIGLNLAISRPQLALDIPRFRETLKALLHMRVQGDSTMDMFGTETYDTAIEEAERRAAIAGRRQREIADKLAIFKAGRVDRGKAAALGIDINVKDEAAVEAEEKRLRLEAERWRDWPQYPDLVQQVVAEEQGVGEVNPQVDMTPAEVEVSDVEAAAEEAVVPVEKPKKRRGRKKDAPAPAPTAPSAGLGDAKEHLKKGFDEAIAGLDELFSKPDDQSTGGPARADAGGVGNLFDPAKYEAALPHLRKAWQEFLAAGKSVGAYYANIIGRYGKAIKPYLDKFVSEALGLSVARSEAKHVVARETQGGYLVSSKGLTKASFERFRDLCRENGGRYDSREKAWFFQSAEAVDRISEAIESFIARLEDQTTEDFAKVYEKKSGPVLKKTTLRSDEEYRAQVSDETKALLGKGREFGMTKEAVDGQAEDAGRILSAFSDGRKAFILANQAGSGKTFVLGAAIREMRARGVTRFVYYTMNQNLIRQIKRDLAEYGVDDITFATYSELQKSSEPLDDAVVIYDESHNIKNVKEAASAQKAKAAMPDARFVIFSSATPFESPTQAAYMAASGLFDAFGDESHEGFFCWACAHGATAKIVSRPGYRGGWVEEVVLEWSHKKTGDAKRANQSLRDMGVFQQRRVKLPKGLVSIRLKRVPTTDQALADIYNRAAAVFDGLVEANPDSFIISSYRENLLKRITEAAKVDAAIAEVKRLLAEGKNIVIFTETKSERQMGKFQSKTEKNSPYYSYPQMLEKMEQWRFEKDRGADSPPPFSSSIMAIAGAMHYAGLDETNLPAVVETLETALSEYGVSIFTGDVSAAKADQNKAAFMSGQNRVLIATMAKGGTGLSLHDQIGNRPTVQVALNLPWTASAVDQVSARTARQGLKSEAEIVWLFSNDLGWESEKLVPRVAGRMKSMGASVSGDVAGVAHLIGGHSDTEFDVSDMRVDEETESALKAVYEGTDVKLSAEANAGPAAAVEERDAIGARILIAVKGVARGLGLRVNIQLDDRQDKSHIDGGYKDGTVYLNYAGIIENSRRYGVSPEAYAVGKVIHEGIIHHGFSFLSEKSRQHLTAWVESQVGMEEIRKLIPDMDAYNKLSKEALVEEYIARIAERARTDGALTEMQGGVWRRVVAAFRKAFRVKLN